MIRRRPPWGDWHHPEEDPPWGDPEKTPPGVIQRRPPTRDIQDDLGTPRDTNDNLDVEERSRIFFQRYMHACVERACVRVHVRTVSS